MVSPAVITALYKSGQMDKLIDVVALAAKKYHGPVYAANSLPFETLKRFGLPGGVDAFFIQQEIGVPSGLWMNLTTQLVGVSEQWVKGEAAHIPMYPIIKDAITNASTGEKFHILINLPQHVLITGDRVHGSKSQHTPPIEHIAGLLVEGKQAAILLSEVYLAFNLGNTMLINWSLDVTNPDVRYEASIARGEPLKRFEQKLAGKSFCVIHEGNKRMLRHVQEYHTDNGRDFYKV